MNNQQMYNQQMYNQQMYNNQQVYPQQNRQNNFIIWVQGIEGAKAYQLPINSNALLMDSESDTFYLKATDAFGKCSELKQYKYTEVKENPKANVDMTQYVTKTELEQLLNEMLGGTKNE